MSITLPSTNAAVSSATSNALRIAAVVLVLHGLIELTGVLTLVAPADAMPEMMGEHRCNVWNRPNDRRLNAPGHSYKRTFGAGPRGLLLSIGLLLVAAFLRPFFNLPAIMSGASRLRWTIFGLSSLTTVRIVCKSVVSLPVATRGTHLATSGLFRYVRHPLYAAFLSCFNFGFALLLNNWIYVGWAILLHPLWHWNVLSEERQMAETFPDEYDDYCSMTGRFVPRLRSCHQLTHGVL